MKTHSLKRRLIVTMLLLELAAALALTAVSVVLEEQTRMRSFEASLRSQADMLFGAIGDADDPADNIVLDLRGIHIPRRDLFLVSDPAGHVLGRSAGWPRADVPADPPDGISTITVGHRRYGMVALHAVRVVDPGERGGGVRRPVLVLYAAPTAHVWHEVWESVRSYLIASLVLLFATALAMVAILRRGLAPLAKLAEEASKISLQQWHFHPPQSARAVTELEPLSAALQSTISRLQRSFEQQRRFTSDAAHELKTDLAIIKSSLQLLALRPRSPQDYQRGLDVCLTDTLRLERTVAEMLTLARVESAGPLADTRAADCDLSPILREVVEQFASLAALRKVHVLVDAPPVARVRLREEDARILCTNLFLNALQHSRFGSEVHVFIEDAADATVLRVIDHGDGVPPEALPHVFEPFFRSDASRNRKTGGTGLGLAICKGICDRAGGAITLRSLPGIGTEAEARLPQPLPAPASAAPAFSHA